MTYTLSALQELIYSRLPELKELTFGCWVQKKSKKYFVTYAERDNKHILVSAKSKNAMTVTNRTWLIKDVVVLGHPIQLHHVLRVMGQIIKKYHVEIVSGEDGLGEPGWWAVFYNKNARIEQGANVYWNLALDLSGQSPETLTFLLNLLT